MNFYYFEVRFPLEIKFLLKIYAEMVLLLLWKRLIDFVKKDFFKCFSEIKGLGELLKGLGERLWRACLSISESFREAFLTKVAKIRRRTL